ncbi:hypothetical protein CDAR_479981 [Caerostris darwini]|uniref:Ribosomal protein S14 n=1 Tax=Caerostris darwini TaxID=1538125 RepID=A0AAV4T623_9ARAC|nr:hypothetical protein CDAR_479981 [Caerostris darwini]
MLSNSIAANRPFAQQASAGNILAQTQIQRFKYNCTVRSWKDSFPASSLMINTGEKKKPRYGSFDRRLRIQAARSRGCWISREKISGAKRDAKLRNRSQLALSVPIHRF